MNKKVLVPFIVAPMLLASCAQYSYVGKYSFMMGKQNDSHIGIILELTDQDYEKNPSLGKSFSLTLDSDIKKTTPDSKNLNRDPDSSSSESSSESSEESSESSEETPIDGLFGGGDFSLSGYYAIGTEKNKEGYYSLTLGASILDPEEFPIIEIPEEIVGDIIIAEISKKNIKATIPVSINDLMYQLYWYGWDISIDTSESFVIKIEKSSGENHPHGTHPTSEDIERINKTFPDEHMGFEFHDFDCLTMGLAKETKDNK